MPTGDYPQWQRSTTGGTYTSNAVVVIPTDDDGYCQCEKRCRKCGKPKRQAMPVWPAYPTYPRYPVYPYSPIWIVPGYDWPFVITY